MSGWIKFDKDMALDPRLVTAAAQLRNGRPTTPVTPLHFYCNALRGALVTLWCYADEHIHDDDTLDLTSEALDTIVNLEGFFAVIPRVWVTELNDGRIKLPGYCKKNGLITKRKRAAKSKTRVTNWRARNRTSNRTSGNAGVTHDVTEFTLGLDKDKDLDIEEKKKRKRGERGEAPPAPRKRAGNGQSRPSRKCPEDFAPDLALARSRIPDIDAEREAEKFKRFEFRRPHKDWRATWLNWIDTCAETGRYAKHNNGKGDPYAGAI